MQEQSLPVLEGLQVFTFARNSISVQSKRFVMISNSLIEVLAWDYN